MIIKVRSLSFDDELLALVFCLLVRTDDAIIFEFFNGQTVVTVVRLVTAHFTRLTSHPHLSNGDARAVFCFGWDEACDHIRVGEGRRAASMIGIVALHRRPDQISAAPRWGGMGWWDGMGWDGMA